MNDPVPERFTWRDMLGYKRPEQKQVQKPGEKKDPENVKENEVIH